MIQFPANSYSTVTLIKKKIKRKGISKGRSQLMNESIMNRFKRIDWQLRAVYLILTFLF